MSGQKPTIKTKECPVDFHNKIVVRHRSEHRYKTFSKALSVHRRTLGLIIVIWKKFGNTSTLRRVGSVFIQRGLCYGGDHGPNMTMT